MTPTAISPLSSAPFVVGVSGHRDLRADGLARIEGAVTAFLSDLRSRLPDTELHVLVGMAEGADLLVARAALELGVRVDAVLPMPLEQYSADFDPATFRELTELLHRPGVRTLELAPPALTPTDPSEPATRDALYANLTQTLLRRSSLLLAVWDGAASALPGGTADTLLRYLGVRNDDNRLDERLVFVDTGQDLDFSDPHVYWVPAARRDERAANTDPPCFLQGIGDNELQRHGTIPRRLAEQLRELNQYNRDYRVLSESGRLAPGDSLLGTLPPAADAASRPLLGEVDAQYAKADALAVYFQRRSDALFLLFGAMTFMMGLAFLVYEKVTESPMLLVLYLVILGIGLSIYSALQGQRWFAKHLSYRALAETMRAKFYLRVAGLDQRVDAADVLSLSGIDRFHGFGWISYVIKSVAPLDLPNPAAADRHAVRSRCVQDAWIASQHRYFTRKVQGLTISSQRVKRLRNTLFAVILAVILALFLFGEKLHHVHVGPALPVQNLLTLLMGVLAVLLGVWELHQDKMATHELLWQYQNQLNHFTHAKLQLERITSPSRRDEILVALGKDSLMESYLWTIHRYHREHEPPAAA